jgi:hypothetical protein
MIMALPGPFLAGQRVTAGQLNDATQKTLKSIEVGISGVIATTSGTTELNVSQLALGPVDLVFGGLYQWFPRVTVQFSVGTDEYKMIIRRDTALTGPIVTDWVIYGPRHTGGYLFSSWDDFESSAVDPGVNYFVSFQRVLGTGTLTIYGQIDSTNRTGLKLARTGYSSEFQIVT